MIQQPYIPMACIYYTSLVEVITVGMGEITMTIDFFRQYSTSEATDVWEENVMMVKPLCN